MSDPRIGTLLRRAARLLAGPGPATPDAALLDRFARDRDPQAFAELVARHGPAVWGLCRRLARSEPDAEDTFQATFLVLAQDPRRVRKAASVGSWLYGVAFRLGRKARAVRSPDPARLALPAPAPDPADDLTWREVRAALAEELARLPDRLRAPLLLCYFDGLTQDEAAAALGWNPRTVKARVARGRDLLRTRLTRRGVSLSAALAAPLVSAGVSPAVPPALLAAAARRPSPGPDVSPAVLALAQTEVSAMTAARLPSACAAVLLGGAVVLGLKAGPGADPPPAPKAAPPAAPGPLPAGAVTPIGTTQFRHVGAHKKAFFTADGATLVATDYDSDRVTLWDAATGRRAAEVPLPGRGYRDADFAPGAGLLALIGWHHEGDRSEPAVCLVDVPGRKVARVLRPAAAGHPVSMAVRVTPDGRRVVSGTDGEVRVWDARTGDELIRQKVRTSVEGLAVSADGKAVAVGGRAPAVWRWEAGGEPEPLAPADDTGTALAGFAPDGRTLYGTGPARRLAAWDVVTRRPAAAPPTPGGLRVFALSPDGKALAVGYHDDPGRGESGPFAVTLLDLATGRERARFPVGRDLPSHVNWSPNGARLAAATEARLWVWDVAGSRPLIPPGPGHEGSIAGLAFAPDGTLFTASDDHTIRSWDPAGRPKLELVQNSWVRGLAVSPDGSLVAGSALRNDLRVWDARTGKQRFKLLGNGEMGGKRVVRFTAGGKRLVAWGDDESLRVWEVRNGKLLAEHSTRPPGEKVDEDDPFGDSHRQILRSLDAADIRADGSAFALGSGPFVRILDPMTGAERQKLDVGPNAVRQVAFSPDGNRLAVASEGKRVQANLPDGRAYSSVGDDYPVAVWDLATGKPLWTATAQGSWPGLAYSPDGKRVAVVSIGRREPGYVWVWDAATGKEAGRIELPRRGRHLAFDQTGKRLAVAFADTTAAVYDLDAALKPAPRE